VDKKEMRSYSFFPLSGVEIRATNADGGTTIVGYAAMFNALSVPMWGFREKILPGCFRNSILSNNVRSLWNHNSDFVLGSTKTGSLRLTEDDLGLRMECDLPETQAGKDAAISIRRGDVDGMSFGFNILKQEWDETDPANIVRTLVEVDLQEVSPTAFPAYEQTLVNVRTVRDEYEMRKLTIQKEAALAAASLEAQETITRNSNILKIRKRRIELYSL